MSLCSKPGCNDPGAALLGYDYAARAAMLDDAEPATDAPPHLYVLCSGCADSLTAPNGWTVEDRREAPPLFVSRDVVSHIDVAERGDRMPEPVEERAQLFFGTSA